MNIIFYTTHCPRCKVLESKLNSKQIQYQICEDVDEMLRLGIESIPSLGVNDKILNFKEAIDWANNY